MDLSRAPPVAPRARRRRRRCDARLSRPARSRLSSSRDARRVGAAGRAALRRARAPELELPAAASCCTWSCSRASSRRSAVIRGASADLAAQRVGRECALARSSSRSRSRVFICRGSSCGRSRSPASRDRSRRLRSAPRSRRRSVPRATAARPGLAQALSGLVPRVGDALARRPRSAGSRRSPSRSWLVERQAATSDWNFTVAKMPRRSCRGCWSWPRRLRTSPARMKRTAGCCRSLLCFVLLGLNVAVVACRRRVQSRPSRSWKGQRSVGAIDRGCARAGGAGVRRPASTTFCSCTRTSRAARASRR